jgi:hypothetical protein
MSGKWVPKSIIIFRDCSRRDFVSDLIAGVFAGSAKNQASAGGMHGGHENICPNVAEARNRAKTLFDELQKTAAAYVLSLAGVKNEAPATG